MAPRQRTYGMSYEDFVGAFYATAVSLGQPTREGLRAAGYSEDEIEHGTRECVARGFVRPVGPDAWEVLPPRAAFNAYAAGVQHRLALAQSALDQVESLWRSRQSAAVPRSQGLTMLGSYEEIADHALVMHRGAQRRLAWTLDPSPASRILLDRVAADPQLLAPVPGVELRCCLDTRLLDHPGAVDLVERLQSEGAVVTLGNGLPFGIHVTDDAALIDFSAHGPDGRGVVTTLPGGVAAASTYVDAVLGLATAYLPTVEAFGPGGDGVPLDARDRRVLGLLTMGASDQVIARHLGVSVRTVERRVRYLMDHLGAGSRFQAGVAAVRRGWV